MMCHFHPLLLKSALLLKGPMPSFEQGNIVINNYSRVCPVRKAGGSLLVAHCSLAVACCL